MGGMRTIGCLVVLLAMVALAGAAAWRTSSVRDKPDGRRPEPGFVRLDPASFAQVTGRGGRVLRERHLTRETARSGEVSIVRWLRGLAGSRGAPSRLPRAVTVAPPSANARTATASFVVWADDLPSALWSVEVEGSDLRGNRRTGTVTFTGQVNLAVPQGRGGVRTLHTTVTVVARPTGVRAAAGPRGWRIELARAASGRGLRALRDPIGLEEQGILVIAERRDAARAETYAGSAADALPEARTRWPGLSPARRATLWLLADAATARRVLGGQARGGGPVTEALAWTDSAGDVVIDRSKMDAQGETQALATVRHEIVHVAMLSVFSRAPTVLLEGAAVGEETRFLRGYGLVVPLGELDGALKAGTVNVASLMGSRDPDFGFGADGRRIRLAYLAGYATVAWMDDRFGHERTVRLFTRMRDGATVDQALRAEFSRTRFEVAREVGAWVAARA